MEYPTKSLFETPGPLPHPRSYWARPGKLLAGCYPGSDHPAEAEEKLQGLLRCGVACVINLMEENEKNHTGEAFVPYRSQFQALALQKGAEIALHRFPIVDQNVPTVDEMRTILDTIDAAIGANQIVYVHCWGGRGRTGTVIGCHMQRHGLVPEGGVLQHLAALTRHRRENFPRIPETTAQRQFVTEWRLGL